MERVTQDGYITHRSIHEKIIMHQPSWSYASSITQPTWLWSYEHGKSYTRWLHHTPINTRKIIMHQPSWSYASSLTQPFWRWSYQHGKSYARWLHHTPINTRKDYHASTSMIIRIKHNPTVLAWELWAWKELHKMITTQIDQNTKILSCINLHDHTHQAKPNHLGVGVINMERQRKMVTSHTDQYRKRLSCINLHDHTHQA